jgi:hypothetical protein
VFRMMAMACGQAGWEFRRAGAIDPVVRADIRWLSRYRHQRCRTEPAAAELLEAFTTGHEYPRVCGGLREQNCLGARAATR